MDIVLISIGYLFLVFSISPILEYMFSGIMFVLNEIIHFAEDYPFVCFLLGLALVSLAFYI